MAQTATRTPQASQRKPGSKDQWAKRGIHIVTLPSGMVVKIRLPDLTRLLKNDLLPERLRAVALKQAFAEVEPEPASDNGTRDEERYQTAKDMASLLDWLVADMVLEPQLTQEDVETIPGEDRDMLVSIAQRERDTDHLGVTLGVDPLSRWDTFRSQHKCPENCAACEKVRQEFSSVELG